jgi:hypothetical protein
LAGKEVGGILGWKKVAGEREYKLKGGCTSSKMSLATLIHSSYYMSNANTNTKYVSYEGKCLKQT